MIITGEQVIEQMVSMLRKLDDISDVIGIYNVIMQPAQLVQHEDESSAWPLWGILTGVEMREEGSTEKQFRAEEVIATKRYHYAGKLGPWARPVTVVMSVRYLATGPCRQPVYRRILSAEKEGDSWHYLRVRLEGETDTRSCWCGTNIYRLVQ